MINRKMRATAVSKIALTPMWFFINKLISFHFLHFKQLKLLIIVLVLIINA